MKPISIACLVSAAALLAACSPQPTANEGAAPAAKAGMANPASVHCEKLGGKLDIRTSKDGGQYGMCSLPDGRVCEEWALFRDGQCKAGPEAQAAR